MAAPSTVYLARFSDSEKADNVRLLTANDVGRYFQNLIEASGLRFCERELQKEAGVSAEALKRFLDSMGSNTVGGFKRFLEESGGLNLAEYANLKLEYEKKRFKGFTLGLYFIDKELLVKRGGISALYERPESARDRIKIMLSAILWIEKLDCSCDKHEWKMLFISFNRDRLNQDLRLLWGTWLLRSLQSKSEFSIPDDAQTRLNKLWEWFDTHNQRTIKLAFCMAREGLLLEPFGKMGEVHRFIDEVERL
jgi:hypothetical protein